MDYIDKINVGSRSYDVPQWLSTGLLSLLPLIPQDIQNGELTVNIPSSKDDSQTAKALFFLGKLPELINSNKEIDYLVYVAQLAILTQRYGVGDELKSLVLTMLNILEYFAIDIYETKLYPFVSLFINILNDKFIPIQPPNYTQEVVNILNIEGEYMEKLNPILREYLQNQMTTVWKNIYKRDDYNTDVIRLIVHDICHTEVFNKWNMKEVLEYNNLTEEEFDTMFLLNAQSMGAELQRVFKPKDNNNSNINMITETKNVITDGITINYKINDIYSSNTTYFKYNVSTNNIECPYFAINDIDGIKIYTGLEFHKDTAGNKGNKFINISNVNTSYSEMMGRDRNIEKYRIIGNEQLYNMLAKPTFSQLAYIMEYTLYYKSDF